MPTINNLPKLTDQQRKLVEDNINLAYKYANEIAPHTLLEYEDVIQYCMLGLCKAILIYDSTKGKLSSLAYQCMRNEIYMKVRPTKKRSEQNSLLSLDMSYADLNNVTLADVIKDPLDRIDETELYIDLMSAIEKVPLSRRRIAQYLVDNPQTPQKEAAEQFNCSQSNISKAKSDLKKHWLID